VRLFQHCFRRTREALHAAVALFVVLLGASVTHAQDPTDGSTFPQSIFGVQSMAQQPDGQILMGGNFSAGEIGRAYLMRVAENGRLDASFNPEPNARLRSVALQPDGKILVSGDFTTIASNARNALARLNADGSFDASFNAGFSSAGPHIRYALARLGAFVPAQQSLRMNGSTLTWLRSGAAPELSQAPTAQISSDGLSFIALGTMQRVAGGWSLSGISLPVAQNRLLRVSAPLAQGQQNGSGGRIKSTRVFFCAGDYFCEWV
jgi:uncharacterized delta-60 repeat protein